MHNKLFAILHNRKNSFCSKQHTKKKWSSKMTLRNATKLHEWKTEQCMDICKIFWKIITSSSAYLFHHENWEWQRLQLRIKVHLLVMRNSSQVSKIVDYLLSNSFLLKQQCFLSAMNQLLTERTKTIFGS